MAAGNLSEENLKAGTRPETGSKFEGRSAPAASMEILRGKRSAILADWLARIADSYSPEMSKLLLDEKDPFRNPVGETFRRTLPLLLDDILAGTESAAATQALGDIMHIRAVQDFSPAQAVAFMFQLKDVFREQSRRDATGYGESPAVEGFMDRIDRTALRAFDSYVACREAMHRAKLNEIKRRTYILERTHPAYAVPHEAEEERRDPESGRAAKTEVE